MTVRTTAGLIIPSLDAEILVVPLDILVAKPLPSTAAVPVAALVQSTLLVISCVEPFEYVPIAVKD